MTTPRRILCVGTLAQDTVVRVARIPNRDERVIADQLITSVGGPAAVAAVTIARLGGDVALVATVGRDPAGDFVLDWMVGEGVDVSHVVRRDGETTAVSVVVIEDGSTGRRIIVGPQPRPPALSNVDLDGVAWVHADQTGWAAVQPDARDSRRRWRLSVDAGNPIADFDATGVDLLAPTVFALSAQYGGLPDDQLLEAAVAAGAGSVVATDGARGAFLRVGTGPMRHIPGFSVLPVSTLGAGDVFHGALLATIARGHDLPEAVRVAHATAALSCLALDGPSGIPSFPEVEAFMAARTNAVGRDLA